MKKILFALAILAFTFGAAQKSNKKACCADKDAKECASKDAKKCSAKEKKACSTKKAEKKACCASKKA